MEKNLRKNPCNKRVRGVIRLLLEIAVCTALILAVRIAVDGMYLLGLPDLDELQSVSIAYPSVTDEVKEVSSEEDMELALKLTGFLKYDLLKKADPSEGPLITITYHLKDGTDKVVSADRSVVWWNGNTHPIKDEEMFVNLTEGIFFFDEILEKENGSPLAMLGERSSEWGK